MLIKYSLSNVIYKKSNGFHIFSFTGKKVHFTSSIWQGAKNVTTSMGKAIVLAIYCIIVNSYNVCSVLYVEFDYLIIKNYFHCLVTALDCFYNWTIIPKFFALLGTC